jgi:GDSL-like Lipase/Acylhydrolase family
VLLAVLAAAIAAQQPQTPATADALGISLRREVDRFVQQDRLAPPAPCQILFVGSSSIVKWRATLAADMAPLPVINRGFGSSQFEYVNRWFDELVTPYRPRAIVLYEGENDLAAGKTMSRVVKDFDTFMQLKTQRLEDTPVYFISVKPSKARFAQLPLQSAVNAQVRERAAHRGDVHFIDVVPQMLADGKPRDIFEPDGLHMTREGYLIWRQLVRAALLPDTEAQARRCHARASSATAAPAR